MNCIYCEAPCKFTREHVFPDFLLRAADRLGVVYSNAARRYFETDAVVRDTCSICNNKILGALDVYASGLHKKYFDRVLITSRTIKFDFDRLLRWVLKVTFNAQRAFGGSPRNLLHLRQYMLGHCARPSSLMFLGVVMKRSWVDGGWKNPRDYRASDIRLPEIDLGLEVKFCHMLVINSFCFVVADLITTGDEERVRLASFLNHQIGAKEITLGSNFFEFDSEISKIDHVGHNIRQSEQNAAAYPDNKEVVIGEKRLMLTGLPRNYAIQRKRIRDAKHYLITVAAQNNDTYACLVLTQFASELKEFTLDIRSQVIPVSKRCYASVRRGKSKTYITLYDPNEPGVPYLSTPTGTEQSVKNWELFKNAIIGKEYRLFIADEPFLKNYTTIFNAIEVISIEE